MFVRKQHYDNAIQKVRINLGLELGLESAEDAYVVFREPSEREVLGMRSAQNDTERVDEFEKIFKQAMKEHNFFEEEGVKMKDDAVIDLLFEKVETANKLMTDYSTAVFRSRVSKEEGK